MSRIKIHPVCGKPCPATDGRGPCTCGCLERGHAEAARAEWKRRQRGIGRLLLLAALMAEPARAPDRGPER